MSLTLWILIILAIIYVPVWYFAWKSPNAKKYRVEKYGPAIKINTHLGIKTMDRVCKYRRFWRFMGVLSQILAFLLMVLIIYVVIVAVINLPSTLSRGGIGIEYALAIPGLNPILPFWYGLAALIIALVCHEFAHGVQARANGLRVKNTGLLYAVVPLGAFVEPEEEDVEKASRKARLDLYAAGIATNFVIGAVAFLLFSTVLLGGISSPYEDNAAVYGESEGSPADLAGIPAGAIILEIDGEEFVYSDSYDVTYSWDPGSLVTVTYVTEGGESHHSSPMRWGVYVSKTVDGEAAETSGIISGSYIVSIDGNKFYTSGAFSNFMSTTRGEQTVSVDYIDPYGSYVTTTLVLGSNGSIGYLGVYTDLSGMNLITPKDLLDYASNPFYGSKDILTAGQGLLGYLAHPFSGFDPVPESVQWWYGDQSGLFWMAVTLLYWIFWINILLGISNALPAFPFDGGYVFLGWVDRVLEKMGQKDEEARAKKANEIAGNVSTLMLFLYILIIIVAIL